MVKRFFNIKENFLLIKFLGSVRFIIDFMQGCKKLIMKKIVDDETKTIWYHSESGYPTYMAIDVFRKRIPSYSHSIASKECWERLCKSYKPIKVSFD